MIIDDEYSTLTSALNLKSVNIWASTTYTASEYDCICATVLKNDDYYYLVSTDAIYPTFSLIVSSTRYALEIMTMNKSSLKTTANRNIYVRFILRKK